jgi:plasmid stabilization system protein ParE
MSYRLIIKPQAEEDIKQAVFWYQMEKEGLGSDFLAALSDQLQLIEQHPYQYALRYKDLRAALLSKFPYLIYYRIIEQTIRVLAVLHTKRNPGLANSRR